MINTSKYIFLLVIALLVTMLLGVAVGMYVGKADDQVQETGIVEKFDLNRNKAASENDPKMIIEIIPEVQLLTELIDMIENPDASHYLSAEQEIVDGIVEQTKSMLTSSSKNQLYNYISVKNSYSTNMLHLQLDEKESPSLQFYHSLKDFYEQCHYKTQNYDSDIADYTDIIYNFRNDLDIGLYTWLSNFFGQPIEFYNIILIPDVDHSDMVLFIEEQGDKNILFHIFYLTDSSSQTTANQNLLTISRWSKFLYQPLINRHQELINQLGLVHYFYPVTNLMKEKNIIDMNTFLSELLTRSVTAYYLKTQYDEATYIKYVDYQVKQGFYMIEESVEQIAFYAENKQLFNHFEDFIPYYIKELSYSKDEIIADYYADD
ncbi:DUF4932 domain-containing protein [Vallitalea okinawensis]|uniref:DUF4932 domain-containing protein n=1 Tax=Vallitalea okinawensis TaxID=2078660 RepID=UPI0014785781|nr:DUF4932 domain-containing protein [Vallitalea okinawensis]